MSALIQSWRITSEQYQASAFEGEGARRFGGRWNSPGRPMIYLAGSLALAALEQLVHLSRTDLLEDQFVRFRVRFPEETVLELDRSVLSGDWTDKLEVTRRLGDSWSEAGDSLALEVPSAIVTEESNYLVNPDHPAFDRIEVGSPEPFTFDERLSDLG